MGLHMWYLTQELVPLCLFSKSIHQSEKLEVAKAILKAENCDLCKNREGAGYGKPVFSKIENLNSLAGCVGADSWPFFQDSQNKSILFRTALGKVGKRQRLQTRPNTSHELACCE